MDNTLYEQLLNATKVLYLVEQKNKEKEALVKKVQYICREQDEIKRELKKQDYAPSVRAYIGTVIGILIVLCPIIMIENLFSGNFGFGCICCLAVSALIIMIAVTKYAKKLKSARNLELYDQEKIKKLSKINEPRFIKIKELEEEMDEIKKKYEFITSVLPEKYRNFNAASYILDAIINTRADTLKEAINLYEQALHNWRMEKLLENHIKMNEINAKYTSSALLEIQRNQNRIVSELRNVESLQQANLNATLNK